MTNRRNEDTTTIYKKTTIYSILSFKLFFKFLYACNLCLDSIVRMLASERKIENRLQVGNKVRTKEKGRMMSSKNCITYGKPLSLPIKFIIHLVWKHIIPPTLLGEGRKA